MKGRRNCKYSMSEEYQGLEILTVHLPVSSDGMAAPAQSRLPDVRGVGARVGQAQPASAHRAGPDCVPQRCPVLPAGSAPSRKCWVSAITGSCRCILETLWMAHSSCSDDPAVDWIPQRWNEG